jgi:hypothetical protein
VNGRANVIFESLGRPSTTSQQPYRRSKHPTDSTFTTRPKFSL